ncbi:SAM-dependent methyltransferase, BioC-like [hydrothermal vent metagenome]|uniref:SAM-dependent methyltransferase, BioC-like n=1 Tax=hydrothermal vent metagenome TaxID=652676 RepID=A0A3B0S4Q7_9ZZZZ
MAEPVKQSEIFDRKRRRLVRDRSYRRTGGHNFLMQIMSDEILDRLNLVKRNFSKALLIGQISDGFRLQLSERKIATVTAESGSMHVQDRGGIQCDEDRIPFADHSFDLVININTLDTVNDLPGALALTRRILKPDGFFLASVIGAGSLSSLKAVLIEAEGDKIAPHIHPQIDVRTLGDLMTRAGLTLPVTDVDKLRLRYPSLKRLVDDLRDIGGTNILADATDSISKAAYNKAKKLFRDNADAEGKTEEILEIIYLCGWAPHPDQPKPTRRGSAQTSLKSALKS